MTRLGRIIGELKRDGSPMAAALARVVDAVRKIAVEEFTEKQGKPKSPPKKTRAATKKKAD